MKQNAVETVIADWCEKYADERFNVCDVQVDAFEGTDLRLRGRVLEAAQRQELLETLAVHFPLLQVDVSLLSVLRQSPPALRWVGTNLSSLHVGPSFLAEMETQMLNGLAVEVLSEEGLWGYVRQPDGYLGWTYLHYLTETPAPRANALVIAPVGLLRDAPDQEAGLVTRVLGGTFACISKPDGQWVALELAGGWKGWLPVSDLRVLDQLPVETDARRAQMVADGLRFVGVPYVWGGSSPHGIDCSGFAQLLHRWAGFTLPRDADLQYAAGQPVEPPFAAGDLLFFGEAGARRRITHVAVSMGGWRILHSSRSRNGVQVDDVQAVASLRDSFLCAATYLGR